MGDSWDDDGFEVALPPGAKVVDSWEDEEEVDEAVPLTNALTAEQKEKAAEREAKEKAKAAAAKKVAQEEALLANMTDEERRLHRRQIVEDADHALSEDLFGKEKDKKAEQGGIENMKLKNLQDHIDLAFTLGEKLQSSKSHLLMVALKELLKQVEGKLSVEDVGDLVSQCLSMKERKEAASYKPAPKQQSAKVSKAKKKAVKKKHTDIFGGDFDGDAIENVAYDYEDAYDSFM